jgi:TonB family protein
VPRGRPFTLRFDVVNLLIRFTNGATGPVSACSPFGPPRTCLVGLPPHAHGKVGEARLAFSIDRGGRVLTSRIVHSSDSEALDEEALALIKRAAPLPPPPAGVPDDRLSFVVPIRYH